MIDSFRGEYYFLSNFYPVRVSALYIPEELGFILTGATRIKEVESVEHAYQAFKAKGYDDFIKICKAKTPAQAKRFSKYIYQKQMSSIVRLGLMEFLLKQKFEDLELKKRLIDTNDELLIEGNNWGDTFWGVCNGEGENHLGRLLMKIRESIR